MQRLVLFAKRPVLGRVKTRLVPPLEPDQALALYRAFLSDQIRFLRAFTDRCDVELCLDEPLGDADGVDPAGLEVTTQGRGDLGSRLLRAFQRSWNSGCPSTVVLGSDSPTIPQERVREAFRHLEAGSPLVVAPAEDGGYVLIGLREPLPELFRAVSWGGPTVMETTRRRAADDGLDLVELSPWYDVDDVHGLRRLRLELAAPGGAARAPATARALASLDET